MPQELTPEQVRNLTDYLLDKRVISPTGCWLYEFGYTYKGGYKRIKVSGRKIPVHIIAYIIWKQNYTPILQVMHSCDIPKCFNPEHLSQGTAKQNMQDCVKKRRFRKMTRTHCEKGHEYTKENTRWYRGYRRCRQCASDHQLFHVRSL